MATKSSSKSKSSSRKKSSGSSSRKKSSSASKKFSATRKKSSATKKSPAKKSSSSRKKSSARKYSPSAGKNVEKEMHKYKKGSLKSGSGGKVKSKKQAIAIGLSEARRSGKKVPKKKS